MIAFTIPYPATKQGKTAFCRQYGLNAYYAGKHWTLRCKDAEALHTMTLLALKRNRIERDLLHGPVELRFLYDDGLDVDNHAVIGKAILDALKGYLLPDDSPKYVRRITHEMWDGGEIRVEVRPYAG